MAIDTEAKRRSVAGHSFLRIRCVPDGTIDASDRRHAAGFYSGIAAGAPDVPTPGGSLSFTIAYSAVRFTVTDPVLAYAVRNPSVRFTVGG